METWHQVDLLQAELLLVGGGGGEKPWGHGDLYVTLNAQPGLSRVPLPAGGWKDALLLGLLLRIFTLSLTALFPCLSVPLFIRPSTSCARKDKNRAGTQSLLCQGRLP